MRAIARVTMASTFTLQQRLDAFVAGQCNSLALTEGLLAHCAEAPRASWEALALLDQYQRRGKLPLDLQRSISQSIQRRALGIQGGERVSVAGQIDLTKLEAANQGCVDVVAGKAARAAPLALPRERRQRRARPRQHRPSRHPAWQWPARSVQLMAVVAFMLAVGASQGLGEHENGAALRIAPPSPRIMVPGRLAFAADTFIVQPGGQSATVSVARLDGTDGTVSFRWWTQAAGAKAGADYLGRRSARVSMPPGTAALQLTVPILKNPARRHTEFFYVAIGDPEGGARLGDPQRTAVFLLPR